MGRWLLSYKDLFFNLAGRIFDLGSSGLLANPISELSCNILSPATTKTQEIAKPPTISKVGSILALVFIILAVPIIYFGVYPKPIINTSHETSTAYVQHITQRVKAGTY